MTLTTPSAKKYFLKAAIGLAAALGAAVYFGQSDNAPKEHPADPMAAAAKIVAENMQKPCAENAGKISAILLSDPKLKCNGPHVLAP